MKLKQGDLQRIIAEIKNSGQWIAEIQVPNSPENLRMSDIVEYVNELESKLVRLATKVADSL
jgi:hypothetical protein